MFHIPEKSLRQNILARITTLRWIILGLIVGNAALLLGFTSTVNAAPYHQSAAFNPFMANQASELARMLVAPQRYNDFNIFSSEHLLFFVMSFGLAIMLAGSLIFLKGLRKDFGANQLEAKGSRAHKTRNF